MAVARRLTEYAVLSASGHNTQPWRVRILDDSIRVEPEQSRVLRFGGVDGAEPHVSLGAFAETFLLAGRGFGIAAKCDYGGSDATIRLKNEIGEAEPQLLDAICHRHSNRRPFDVAPLAPEVVAQLEDAEIDGASVTFVSDRDGIEFIADQTEIATREIMALPEFRRELAEWIRNNLTRQPDGMPGFTQGMPTPLSLVAPLVIRSLNIGKYQAKTDAYRARQSSVLAILRAGSAVPDAMFAVGRLFSRLAVQAGVLGLSTSAIASPVVAGQTSASVCERFSLQDVPVVVMRIGRSDVQARPTPRRMAVDVIV